MILEAGTTLGSYQILSAIGAGGMGEVYRAKDTKLDREVAGPYGRGFSRAPQGWISASR